MKTNKVILIIDDEFIILESIKIQLRRFLNEDDHIIELASSGEEAFEIINDYHTNNLNIDLIITDYHLDDMTGIEIINFSHEKFPNCKKYLLSGEVEDRFENGINNVAINGYLPKPWEFEVLKKYVLKSLKK
jgi:YesN/AraC family two-component response regulator